jgi:predicted membrane channel-forming protein YqfA (hemolysin III family)
MAGVVLIGAGFGFYVTKIPESLLSNGTFDIFGSSHQIWHLLVFVSMYCIYSLLEEFLIIQRNN